MINNIWQENLNTWIFRDAVIQIKNYAHQDMIRLIDYSIDRSFDGQFILKTSKATFGDLYVEFNYKNALPKLLLSSKVPGKFLELQACNAFTNEQKSLIHSRINALRNTFEVKKQMLEQKATSDNKKESVTFEIAPEFLNAGAEVDRLVTIIHTTMNVASDFQAYFEQIDNDISKLESKINNVNPAPFRPIK